MDLATIAQTVSAIGTLLLAALFGYQVTVFKQQVAVNRGTLDEMREGRTAHERPQVVVIAEYRHGTLVEVVISNIGRGDAKNVTFEFSAPMESSVSYRRDSEVVPLSELPHFRDGMNYLAPGAEISTVWDHHANLVPLLRETELGRGLVFGLGVSDTTLTPPRRGKCLRRGIRGAAAVKRFFVGSIRQLREELTAFKGAHPALPWDVPHA